MRANAALLQMLHRSGRGATMKMLPGLVADLLRDAAEVDRMVEAEVFMASQMPTRSGRKAA
jgi:hypothetical protein